MIWFPRVLGAATAGYGLLTLVRPHTLARPVELAEPDGGLSPSTRLLAGLIGARDVIVGGWMVIAPPGRPLRTAIATRVLFDAGDAALFGLLAPTDAARRKAATVAAGWSALCALSALAAGRSEPAAAAGTEGGRQ